MKGYQWNCRCGHPWTWHADAEFIETEPCGLPGCKCTGYHRVGIDSPPQEGVGVNQK